MTAINMIKTYVEYHYAMTRRVWESIDHITDEQFLQDDSYSRGSIRNLMTHLTRADERWLVGWKNLPDPNKGFKFENYPTRAAAREYFESVANDMTDYVSKLTEADLDQNPTGMPGLRWQVLLHMVNHGTDHRAQALHLLHNLGAPTFDQDFILWLPKK